MTVSEVHIMQDIGSTQEPKPWVVLLRVGDRQELLGAAYERHARLLQQALAEFPDERAVRLLSGQE